MIRALSISVLSFFPFVFGQDALSPTESLAKIHVPHGFHVELAAAEPLTMDPVAIDWDSSGRLWVVEMADYPLGLDGKGKPGGRIRVLEDTNHDGRYDKSTLFAEGLNFPTGLITWRDGVIVTAAPEILFLQDTNHDGRADVREVLFSGFLEGNQQLRMNGLRWGLDNWIYCAVGGHYRGYGAATKIKSHKTGEEISLGSRDFRFRPDTGTFEPESGPSQFGRNRDDWGHWFGTQNSNPLWQYVLPDRYLRRNPHTPAADPVHQVITPVNPKVFPISAPEKRYHSYEHADRFTSACSGMIYRDTVLFPAGETHAFVCEPVHNLVHHEILTDDGVTFAAHRAPGEETSEFFASEDGWTRPVMVRTGPDGALWVVDMYRDMIEHPDWLPENGRAEMLPRYRRGEDKGRIYRVLPNNRKPNPALNLEKLSMHDLVNAMDSDNEWRRDKAQQLLLWRNDRAAVGPLKRLTQSKRALARLHALCTLDGLGMISKKLIGSALNDPNPGIRENAIRLAETDVSARFLTDDPSPKVRLQLAYYFGGRDRELRPEFAPQALANLALKDHSDPYMVSAIMSSVVPHLDLFVRHLSAENGPALKVFAEPLYNVCLSLNRADLLQKLLDPIIAANDFKEYSAYLQLLRRRNLPLPPTNPELIVAAKAKPVSFEAARFLALIGEDRPAALEILTQSIQPSAPAELQRAAITTIAETADSSAPELLLRNWQNHTPDTRAAILETLLRRESSAFALLQKIEAGAVPAADIDQARRNRLQRIDSARVRDLAKTVFKPAASNRAKVIEEFHPALELTGNPSHGREVYEKTCIVCHQRDGKGNDIGPDLRAAVDHPPDKLLANILDPSADIQPGYHAYNCVLKNGEELYGLIASETAPSIVLKSSDGSKRTILRQDIASLRSTNLSLMPDGLETGLTKQDVADLISFLRAR
jgi:putative membrane-bound dehydrogenase-like protein